MHQETLEFQKLREAIISAQMRTSATLVAERVYEDEDGQAFAAVHAVSERCASTGRYRWRLASAKGAAEDRIGPGQACTGG